MNSRQRIILKLALAALILAFLFPPFYGRLANGIISNLGYGFIFDPPKFGALIGSVDIGILVVEWILIVAITGVAWWLSEGATATAPHSKAAKIAGWFAIFFIIFLAIAIGKGLGKAAYSAISSANTEPTKPWDKKWDDLEPVSKD